MAKIFRAARCRGDFAGHDNIGKRDLHRLRWWEGPSSRISKRTGAAKEIRTREGLSQRSEANVSAAGFGWASEAHALQFRHERRTGSRRTQCQRTERCAQKATWTR